MYYPTMLGGGLGAWLTFKLRGVRDRYTLNSQYTAAHRVTIHGSPVSWVLS